MAPVTREPLGQAVPSGGHVAAMLADAVRRTPTAPAVRDAERDWNYAELDAAANAVRDALRRSGVRPGDRVALRSRNRCEVAAALFGTLRAGAALVPLSPQLPPTGLVSVLADAEPAVLLAPAKELPELPEVPCPVTTLEDAVTPGASEAPDAPADPTATALLVYTSGSTSAPKGVVCPHSAVDFAARAINRRLGYRTSDVVLVGSPFSFDYGLYQLLLSVLAGAELVLADAEDPVGMLKLVRRTRATVLPIVPSTARMLARLARRGEPVDHVRMFTNTGAALTASDVQGLRDAFPGCSVVLMYGITECKRVTIAEPDVDLTRPGSSGTALDGTVVRIVDEAGREVPAGVVGEITVTGPHVMAGYRGAPELTAQRYDEDPYGGGRRLRTGDYGTLDADGHLYFHGRRDDQFKRRGVRASLIEVEAAAARVPGVRAVAVLPPEDDRDLTLFFTGDRDPHEVLDEMAGLLEPAKVPADCHRLPELPLTGNGKTDKKRLREMPRPTTGSAT
ncbi:class I adenylate-forming enzyme family protein [Streptomyces alkaliterrae]|nr:AMP-binding protein [Streptomyces alkaliterrae]